MNSVIEPLSDKYRNCVAERTNELFGGTTVISRGVLHEPAKLPGFIALSGKELVGLATYFISDSECELVTIDALIRERSIGTQLLTAVEAIAQASDCSRLWLVTTNDNVDALRFYEKRGYNVKQVHRNAIAKSRMLKPAIPEFGDYGTPIRDEIELEKKF